MEAHGQPGMPDDGRQVYAVSVRGRLGEALCEAFHPMVPAVVDGCTVLTGPIEDQSALHGVLAKIQSFGLELDEVRHLHVVHRTERVEVSTHDVSH